MPTEKRKYKRKPLFYPAQIDPGSGLAKTGCNVSDISDAGAKLTFPSPTKVPQEFTLFLTGAARHFCRVIWHANNEVGVKFVK